MGHHLGILQDQYSNFDRIYTADDVHIKIILEEICYVVKLAEPHEHQWYGFSTIIRLSQAWLSHTTNGCFSWTGRYEIFQFPLVEPPAYSLPASF